MVEIHGWDKGPYIHERVTASGAQTIQYSLTATACQCQSMTATACQCQPMTVTACQCQPVDSTQVSLYQAV